MNMQNIYTIHGIVENYQPEKHIYRSYVPKTTFEDFLNTQSKSFGKWEEGRTTSDILTIDDSTQGGAEACIMARNLGHEVILFVNPHQIINQEPYWFSLFNCLLDYRSVDIINYKGQSFDLSVYAQSCSFRQIVKREHMCLPVNESMGMISHFKELLGVGEFEMPHHLKILKKKDLLDLIHLGVQIESHGWSHIEISGLQPAQFLEDFSAARQWLAEEMACVSKLYAVPFGSSNPEKLFGDYGSVFLADFMTKPGKLTDNCWNRIDVTKQLQFAYEGIAFRH